MKLIKQSRGFTLIELLIVIAIIAILVIIVVIAVDPVRILREANDRRNSANVRSAGSLISTCIAAELSEENDPFTVSSCASTSGAGSALSSYGTVPPTTGDAAITIEAATDSNLNGKVQICAYSDNPGGNGNIRWQNSTGGIELPAANPALTCPDI